MQAGFEVKSIEKLPQADARTITTSDLQRMIKEKENFILLDIRIPNQVKEHWIDHPSRRLIDLDDLQEKCRDLPRDRKIVLIDLNGRRSPVAGRYLLAKGFKDVVKVNGGMSKWVHEGLPVAKSN